MIDARSDKEASLLTVLIGTGLPLLSLTGIALLLSGAFAVFLSIRREFLPHDVAFLGIGVAQLCAAADCRIVDFMFHDRVAFGGTLMSIAVLYLWLAAQPLRRGERWAWNAFAVSGVAGFLSFLAYLGYGYLDTWHGAATLALIPCFLTGLWRSRKIAVATSLPFTRQALSRSVSAGRWLLIGTGAGMIAAGLTILAVGMTVVFVPQDLAFMRLDRAGLDAVSTKLVPLIAHDRAGFGGGLLSSGLLVCWCAWHAKASRAFHHAILLSGTIGFTCAIGVHFAEGYTDLTHLGPAIAGAALFAAGAALQFRTPTEKPE